MKEKMNFDVILSPPPEEQAVRQCTEKSSRLDGISPATMKKNAARINKLAAHYAQVPSGAISSRAGGFIYREVGR